MSRVKCKDTPVSAQIRTVRVPPQIFFENIFFLETKCSPARPLRPENAHCDIWTDSIARITKAASSHEQRRRYRTQLSRAEHHERQQPDKSVALRSRGKGHLFYELQEPAYYRAAVRDMETKHFYARKDRGSLCRKAPAAELLFLARRRADCWSMHPSLQPNLRQEHDTVKRTRTHSGCRNPCVTVSRPKTPVQGVRIRVNRRASAQLLG